MSPILILIESLRTRSDVGIVDQKNSWLITINKGRDFVCEIIVPHDVLEWYATVKHRSEKKEMWSDWMDYSGYDDSPREKLEGDMAEDITAFVDRVSRSELCLPLEIYKEGPNKSSEPK
jgi:hypothetical protein